MKDSRCCVWTPHLDVVALGLVDARLPLARHLPPTHRHRGKVFGTGLWIRRQRCRPVRAPSLALGGACWEEQGAWPSGSPHRHSWCANFRKPPTKRHTEWKLPSREMASVGGKMTLVGGKTHRIGRVLLEDLVIDGLRLRVLLLRLEQIAFQPPNPHALRKPCGRRQNDPWFPGMSRPEIEAAGQNDPRSNGGVAC